MPGTVTESDPISAVIAGWQQALLQLDGRNALLYLKPQGRGVIPISGEPDAFVTALTSARRGLRFDYVPMTRRPRATAGAPRPAARPDPVVDPGDIRTALPPTDLQTRLLRLLKTEREFAEEQSINVLFLAAGLLHWVDERGQEATAPLVLIPCDLARPSPQDPFTLRREEDDAIANATLLYKLRHHLHLELPEFDSEAPLTGYFEAVASKVQGRPGWGVTPDLFLGVFQYSKLAMWEDLEAMRGAEIRHPLIRALAGGKVEFERMPTGGAWHGKDGDELAGGQLDDHVDPAKFPLVLPADYSQLLAAGAAVDGQHLVVHGPPGTGKSQTIANLIGIYLERGKSVLFVSEKAAALNVVKARLEECGLGQFCLDMHSDTSKARIYGQLKLALDTPRAAPGGRMDYDALVRRRRQLNGYVRALHQTRMPLGRSIFQVHGRLAALHAAPSVPFQLAAAGSLSRDEFADILDRARRVAGWTAQFREHRVGRWQVLSDSVAPAPTLSVQLEGDLRTIAEAARALSRTAEEAGDRLGIPEPSMGAEVRETAALCDLLAAAPGIPHTWLEPERVSRLKQKAAEWRTNAARREKAASEVNALCSAPPPDASRMLREFDAGMLAPIVAEEFFGPEWSRGLAAAAPEIAAALGELPAAEAGLARVSANLAAWLGEAPPANRRGIEDLVTLAEQAAQLSDVPDAWLDRQALQGELPALAETWSAHQERLAEREQRLFSEFDPAILDVADREMLARYRGPHASFLKRFGGQYKDDQRALLGLRRVSGELEREDAEAAVALAVEVKSMMDIQVATEPSLARVFGRRYRGRLTRWETITADMRATQVVLARLRPTAPALRALQDDAIRRDLAAAAAALRAAMAEYDRLVTVIAPPGNRPTPEAPFGSFSARARTVTEGVVALGPLVAALRPLWRTGPAGLETVRAALAAQAAVEDLDAHAIRNEPALANDFGPRYRGWQTDWDTLDSALDWTSRFLANAPTPLPRVLADLALVPGQDAGHNAFGARLREAVAAFEATLEPLATRWMSSRSPWGSWLEAPFGPLFGWINDLLAHREEASDWLLYRSAVAQLEAKLGPGVTGRIRDATDIASEVTNVIERRLLEAWLAAIYAGEPFLEGFSGRDQANVLQEFARLDREKLPLASRSAIRAAVLERYPKNVLVTNAGEMGVLRNEINKTRRQLPVRKLFGRIPQLLVQLKPCMMMSPLAVSQYLPRTALESDMLAFDVVIFDEASQVFPEDAIPAISRGRQVIVVGDENQLPPTSFFRRIDSDEGNDADEEEHEDDAIQGRESILKAMLGGLIGRGVFERHLNVHYRSKHENLIRFSNHQYYNNRLVVFPSPARDVAGTGLRGVFVPEGRYDTGGTRSNRVEAERTVDLVWEVLRSRPEGESCGVVALSRTQASLIEQLISERRQEDPGLEHRFALDRHEPFFVKNLENVQGDERDHIILSVGYGPSTATGQVYQRYGPLNSEKGWRRLNVAVSRARRSMTVVHSLRAEQIIGESAGARALRRYLEFVADPEGAFEAGAPVAGGEHDSDFEMAVESALLRRGYRVARQVGVAGFRVDLAVLSEDGTRCELGIECDGASYHSAPAARDRDWLRQQILEGLGWRIHRVWSTDWVRNPEAELTAIEAAIKEARDRVIEPRAPARPDWRQVDDAVDEDRDEPEEPEPHTVSRWLFPEYRQAEMGPGPRIPTELRYEVHRSLVTPLLRVVAGEGPVAFDVIIERLKRHYDQAQVREAARDNVRSSLEALLREGQVARPGNGDFWMTPGAEIVARGPGEGVPKRKIGQIAPEELQAGVLQVVAALLSATAEDVITESGRQFGFERIHEETRRGLSAALAALVARGEVQGDAQGFLRTAPGQASQAG